MIIRTSLISAFLPLLFFLLCFSLTSHSLFVPFNDPNILFRGRFYTDTQGLRYDWPCSAIQFCFKRATKIYWVGFDSFGHYMLSLNNTKLSSFIPGKNNKFLIYQNSNQHQQTNCLTITKITEDHFGPLGTKKDALFKGIEVEGNEPLILRKQMHYDYTLEFIGDSLTSAYGVMSGRNPKCFLRMRHNQNCLESWAVHLSKKLNADYRIEAESGKGVVINAFGVPGPSMTEMFSKTTSNSKVNTYHYEDKFSPDAVLISLGANDYGNIMKPSEKYFSLSYQKLLLQIAQFHINFLGKKPKIIALCEMGQACKGIKQAVNSFRYSYEEVFYVQFGPDLFKKQERGCIGHWNRLGQTRAAESIAEKVRLILSNRYVYEQI